MIGKKEKKNDEREKNQKKEIGVQQVEVDSKTIIEAVV